MFLNIWRELLVYDNNTERLKMANILSNGLIGRIDVEWDSVWVPEIPTGYYMYTRTDNRFYYFKDHLGSTCRGEGASRSQIRMTLEKNADIVSAQDYYPY
jgi:hypothetical protein